MNVKTSHVGETIKENLPPPFGEIAAYIYVIEFQKRGLPHAHILLTLARKNQMLNGEKIEQKILAQYPNPQVFYSIFTIKM